MRRLLVLVLLSTLVVLGRSPGLAGACSCATATPEQFAEFAEVAFVGTLVEAVDEFPDDQMHDAIPRVFYTFSVERVFKGDVPATVEIVAESGDSSTCGIGFEPGRHLVFAYLDGHSEDLTSNLCSGNQALAEGEDPPAELGEGRVVAGAASAPDAGAGDDPDGVAATASGGPEVSAEEDEEVAGGVEGAGSSGGDDETSTGDLLAALGAVGMGLAVVAAAIAWMVARRRSAS